jgi:hypothetical protein
VAAGDYFARVYPKGSANNATLCYTLRVVTGTASFGDEGLIVDNRINVFPNPVSKTVTVSIPGIQGQADIQVFDIFGRMLVQKNSSQSTTQVDVSKFAPGIYMVKVRNEGKETSIKIVKE